MSSHLPEGHLPIVGFCELSFWPGRLPSPHVPSMGGRAADTVRNPGDWEGAQASLPHQCILGKPQAASAPPSGSSRQDCPIFRTNDSHL